MRSFKIDKSREFLMKRMGDISQLAGTKRYELIDGKAKGIEAVDLKRVQGSTLLYQIIFTIILTILSIHYIIIVNRITKQNN